MAHIIAFVYPWSVMVVFRGPILSIDDVNHLEFHRSFLYTR